MSHRTRYWLVLAAAAFVLLVRAGSVPLLDPDESRFARTSLEMLRSGDLVVPHFEGEPRLVKPPLVHWIQSWVFSLAGPTEWAARLHAAGATLGSMLLLGWLARRRFGPEGRVWAVAVFATMPLTVVPALVGTLDALLAVHVFAVIALDIAGDDGPGSYRAMGTGALLGLGFLVKGPVAVVLPLLVMLAGRTASGRSLLPSPRTVGRAAAAWSVVVLPWALAFIHRIGAGTTFATVRHEVLERYFGGTGHTEPPWFYAQVGLVGFLPWLAPLVTGLVRSWRLRREPVAATALYAGAGLLAGFVFFSFSPSKVASYVLPLAPLAAIVVTWELGREIETPRQRKLGSTLLAATLAGGAAVLALAALSRLEGAQRTTAIVGAIVLAFGALIAVTAAVLARPRWAYGASAAAPAAFLATAVWILFPAVGDAHSAAPLIDAVPELESGRPVVTVEARVPSLTFYLDRKIEVIPMDELRERLDRGDSPLLVMVDVDLPDVPASLMRRLRRTGGHGKYVVFEPSDTNPSY